jgi:hypothetical protein
LTVTHVLILLANLQISNIFTKQIRLVGPETEAL